MSFNSENHFRKSFNCCLDQTRPDLNSDKKAQNQLFSKSNSKLCNIPANSLPQEGEEKNHPYFTVDSSNDCNSLSGFTKHQNDQTSSRITQQYRHSSVNLSQSITTLISRTKPTNVTKLSTNNVAAFENFQNNRLVYNKENASQTTSRYKLKESNEDKKLVHMSDQLQHMRKSDLVLGREARRMEREHLQSIFSGVHAVKPEFSLEQATEDFPALNSSTGSRKYKRVSTTADSSNSGLEYGNRDNATDDSTKTAEKSWKPKKKDPIHISLQTALQSTLHHEVKKNKIAPKKKDYNNQHNVQVGNILDSDKPQQKRGKVRPDKEKKPSKLKCQILLERKERQKVRDDFQAQKLTGSACSVSNCEQNISPVDTGFDDELSSILEHCTFLWPERPISSSNTLCNKEKTNSEVQTIIRTKFHSRRFREYCTNWLTEDLTSTVLALVEKVAVFQDRTFNQNPIKATAKRRYVAGISQTNKYLQLKKIKLLVIAPDLEKNCKEGGLDEKISYFVKEAEGQGVPCVFGPNRKRLGMAVFKKVFVSCVAIMNYDGAEELFAKVLINLQEAQEKYQSITGCLPETTKDELESVPVEAPVSGLDEISASMLATLREELTPAEKLLKAIEHNPS